MSKHVIEVTVSNDSGEMITFSFIKKLSTDAIIAVVEFLVKKYPSNSEKRIEGENTYYGFDFGSELAVDIWIREREVK